MSRNRVSPIRDDRKPLNTPGESLRHKQVERFGDAVAYLAIAGLLIAFAAWEWIAYAFSLPRQPIGISLVAVVGAVVVFRKKLPLIRARLENESLGIEGEKSVAETLDSLRPRGYHVVNDIEGDGHNIDHVLIGPTGVYVIETKCRSKYADRRNARVTYDGRRILVGGAAPDRDPVRQARAAASEVRMRLSALPGPLPPIRSVVLFPGWYVTGTQREHEVWVYNPDYFVQTLDREQRTLSVQTVDSLTQLVEQWARRQAQTERAPQ